MSPLEIVFLCYVLAGLVYVTVGYYFCEFNRRVLATLSDVKLFAAILVCVLLWPPLLILGFTHWREVSAKEKELDGFLPDDPMQKYSAPPSGSAAFIPGTSNEFLRAGFGEGGAYPSNGLLEDYVPLTLEELRPYMAELEEKSPQTQAEILAIAARHGYCWDCFGRLIRIPKAQ